MREDAQITIRMNGVKFYIGYFPYRKKICLGVWEDECTLVKLATFNNEYSAGVFLEKLQELLGLKDDQINDTAREIIRDLKGEKNERES